MGSWPGTRPQQPPGRLAVVVWAFRGWRGQSLACIRMCGVVCVCVSSICESSSSAVAKTSVETERVWVLEESLFSFYWGGDRLFCKQTLKYPSGEGFVPCKRWSGWGGWAAHGFGGLERMLPLLGYAGLSSQRSNLLRWLKCMFSQCLTRRPFQGVSLCWLSG